MKIDPYAFGSFVLGKVGFNNNLCAEDVLCLIDDFVNSLPPLKEWEPKHHDDGDGIGYYLYHCPHCDTPSARKRNYCSFCGEELVITLENEYKN